MSDINLPGISNNIDVKGLIEKLVKAESKKLEGLEEEKTLLDREKSAWSTLGNKINDLQDASRSLHGFRSPFEDKIVTSSNEAAVTATATRTAEPAKSTVTVQQVAQNERIISDPVSNQTIFEPTTLTFRVGDDEVEVHFDGGTLQDLARAINDQAGDYLRAKVTGNTQDTSVLVLEAVKTGAVNRISPQDDATVGFVKKIGLFEEAKGLTFDTELTPDKLVQTEGKDGFRIDEDAEGVKTLRLEPQTSIEYLLDGPVKASDSVVVKVKIRAETVAEEGKGKEEALSTPELRGIGSVTVEDVEIKGGHALSGLEKKEEAARKEPEIVVDNTVFGLGDTRTTPHPIEIKDLDKSFREYTFKLSDIVGAGRSIDRVLFINNNTGRRVEYRDLELVDTSQVEGLKPAHLVQNAQDAVISIDGVVVQRESNTIDDAIQGVTIDVRGESDEEVLLNIDYDYEKITGNIVSLIDKYNELLKYINEQTKVVPGRNLDKGTEAGIMTGDVTIMGLKGKLQRIMMNPYPTDRGRELSLLAQIGISMGEFNAPIEEIRGGYLKIDEDKFIDAFQKDPRAIKQLFGSDTNNDSIIDNGAAFSLDQTLKGYSEPRSGVVASMIASTDGRINRQNDKIKDFNQHLEEYRAKLEQDFTFMQQSLYELEQSQKRIENFSNQFKNK
jgi:flagellar hook-associated protein 2